MYLLRGELKEKVFREARQIAAHLFVETLCGNAVEDGQVCCEHDLHSANDVNAALDPFRVDRWRER